MFNLFSPGKSKINSDIENLREYLKPARQSLIPWNSDEYEHLSYQEGEFEKKRTPKRWFSGIFYTIFNERIVAYAFKKYFWSSDVLMCVQNDKDEYLYHVKGKEIRVAFNNFALGRIQDDKFLIAPKKNKEIGQIFHEHRLGHLIIKIGGKDLAHLRLPDNPENYNKKVFEFISSMDRDTERHFFALVYYVMIRDHL